MRKDQDFLTLKTTDCHQFSLGLEEGWQSYKEKKFLIFGAKGIVVIKSKLYIEEETEAQRG